MDTQTPLCPGSNGTVSRWYQPDPWPMDDDFIPAPDPGHWQEGETAACRVCHAEAPVTPGVVNDRSSGTQYVARLKNHAAADKD
ncbi:hypothetical protein [Streptomyces sp. NPDC054838]